jgi:hypothetical protein
VSISILRTMKAARAALLSESCRIWELHFDDISAQNCREAKQSRKLLYCSIGT